MDVQIQHPPGSPQFADSFVSTFATYTFIVCCWSIIMTLIYTRTGGSVLACMLFHAMLNIAAFSIYPPAELNLMPWLFIPVVAWAIMLLKRPLIAFNVPAGPPR